MSPEKAQDLLDRAFLYTLSYLEEGLSARDISVGALHYLLLQGAEEPLFLPRVVLTGGERLLRPGWVSFTLRLSAVEQGAPIEMMLGRLVHFGAEPDPVLVTHYEALKAAHGMSEHPEIPPTAFLPVYTPGEGGLPGGLTDMVSNRKSGFHSKTTRDLLAL